MFKSVQGGCTLCILSPNFQSSGEGSRESLGGFVAEPGQVQQGSGKSSGGRGGFGAKLGQIQQGSGTCSGEGSRKIWCRARSSSTRFRRTFRRRSEAVKFNLVQSQAKLRRRFRRRFQRRSGSRARSGSTGIRRSFGRRSGSRARSGSTGIRRSFGRRSGSL